MLIPGPHFRENQNFWSWSLEVSMSTEPSVILWYPQARLTNPCFEAGDANGKVFALVCVIGWLAKHTISMCHGWDASCSTFTPGTEWLQSFGKWKYGLNFQRDWSFGWAWVMLYGDMSSGCIWIIKHLYHLDLGLRRIEREESQFMLTKKTDSLEISGSMISWPL